MEGKLLENLNEGYNEATEDLIKTKLTESFKKKDKLRGKISKLQAEKAAMELLYKDNELLGKYMSIIEQIASLNIQDKELDDEIYENMEASGTELLEGKNCDITIKHPYTRTQMNTKQFLQDYSPKTKMYKKYISIIEVKGNIIVKDKKEN